MKIKICKLDLHKGKTKWNKNGKALKYWSITPSITLVYNNLSITLSL